MGNTGYHSWISVFYGLHTPLIALAQRMILSTGLITVDTDPVPNKELPDAQYDWNLLDRDGHQISFSHFKGKTIFFNIWASWCPPCVAEMPGIQSLYEKIDTTKVVFVMLSRDKDIKNALKFIRKKDYTFPVYMVTGPLPDVYNHQVIPTTFIISPDGKILTKHEGMADYDQKKMVDFLEEL